MTIDPRTLTREANELGFQAEMLEKVYHLMDLLAEFDKHIYLNKRLVLKGGTALNLFHFNLPRLSIDIDLNYVGALEREQMLQEKPQIESAVQSICRQKGFSIERSPSEHAGGKMRLRYLSVLGGGGRLELDLNYLIRQPLWPTVSCKSAHLNDISVSFPVLDIHELAAGKLTALFSRRASRDLFDAHHLLTQASLDWEKLRLGFLVYGATSRKDWRALSTDDIQFEANELKTQLIPVLGNKTKQKLLADPTYSKTMLEECREKLSELLPLKEAEKSFLDALLDRGEIRPEYLSEGSSFKERIHNHPGLRWKALNVKQHKGLF